MLNHLKPKSFQRFYKDQNRDVILISSTKNRVVNFFRHLKSSAILRRDHVTAKYKSRLKVFLSDIVRNN